MPKKKSKPKDPKKTTAPETREYQLITLDENHLRQIKHESLIQRIRNTKILIENAEIAVKENDQLEDTMKVWQTYLACDKIPNPFEPQKVRNFFEKTDHFEQKDSENTFNWLLAVDECSILNQDIDSVNMTKKFLKKDRVDFGQQYDVRIIDTMELTRRIQEFLESPKKDLSERVLQDIEELKNFAQNKSVHYIDNLTYRVLSSEAAYMESIDFMTAEYSYKGTHFDIHLWTFQNKPIHLDPEETPFQSIHLEQIKTDLKVPFCVLSENMVIRGLHCHFDHLSSLARYNDMPVGIESERNLKHCLQNEWEIQTKIQAEVKSKLIKERADFEETVRLKAEEEELKAKEAQKSDKAKTAPKKKGNSKNPKKLPKEPQIVTPDMVPVVRMDFLKYDSQNYEERLLKFHPQKLKLSDGEVNLRQFQILGGVYQINTISKPKAENYPKLILTWHRTNKRIEYTNFQSFFEHSQLDDISKFFEITFELADCFCNWGEPIPCFFEEAQYESELVAGSNEGKQTTTLNARSPLIVNDFNLHDLFTKPMMHDFIENSIPRIISSFKFPEELHDDEEDKKSKVTLARTKTTLEDEEKAKELEMQRQHLSFDVQNSPERLFPLFKNVLPVVILPMQEGHQKQGNRPYENFSDFMTALESIKNSYQKTDFKDKLGNPVKILAEDYDGNIRRPRITSKLVAHDQTERKQSTVRLSLLKGARRDSVGSRQSMDRRAQLKPADQLPIKDNKEEPKSKSSQRKQKLLDKNDSMPESRDRKGVDESVEEVIQEGSFSKWSSKNILKSEFNPNERKVTIWTDRLGTFGFAFNRYLHFPFKSWSLQPFDEKLEEFILTVETAFALFKIFIASDGYKAFVTDFARNLNKRKVYLDVGQPVKSIKKLKEILQQKSLNIFPEPDAVWYVNGNFSEKHLATELHTYNCMSLNAPRLIFHSSEWNRQSNRRTMVLQLGELKKPEQNSCLIRINPEDAMFVEIKEIENYLGISELEFTSTWRNMEWYADLNQLISSSFPNDTGTITNDQDITCYLKNLLHAIRPLSFS